MRNRGFILVQYNFQFLNKAISWAKRQELRKLVSELDAKLVVDAVKSSAPDHTEFGSIISANYC